jgi:glycosyltransferase involved in cell wall biosynthesis
MKTILHLIETSGPGGAEKILISLVEHLHKEQYRSIVCLLEHGWLSSQLKARDVQTYVIPQRSSLDINWLYNLIVIIRRHKVNLIHSHEFTMNTYACIVSAFTRIPLIATVHGKNYYGDKLRRRVFYRFVSMKAIRMVAVSKNIKDFLVKEIGVEERRITTIYNGIDEKHHCYEDEEQFRENLLIKENVPIIGTVGNLYPIKGHTYLLKAAVKVVSVFPDATFLIAGRGELLGKLQEEANQLNIKKNVRFLGFREDISRILPLMDLFVLPSLSEGLSVALLEAMRAGKPTIATKVGGNAEVIIEGETGLLVPAEDHLSLAGSIIYLLKDKELAQRMGKAGRTRVEREFSLGRMVENYQELYEVCFP